MAFRSALGRRCGRGALVAICQGKGLYRNDITRAETELNDRIPDSSSEPAALVFPRLEEKVADNLEVEREAKRESVARGALEREWALLRCQWSSPAWLPTLRASGLTTRSLRSVLADRLRARSWIEKKIEEGLDVSSDECATFYNRHPDSFAQPLRLRACHIFFAAPPDSPPEAVEQKRLAAQSVLERLGQGEKFTDLIANSEDEASKKRGGDLNFFSESRMPAEFWEAIKMRRVGEAAAVIRTRLGFHVVQVTEVKPVRRLSLEEAMRDIRVKLESEKRSALIVSLEADLARRILWNAAERRPVALQIP